ncbi:MAG: choice-of-anchor B family protein [Flavobacteriaceae bacterium]|nr:choice-of-anchor B family protein [Flavobacteriaceae bacterium]
MRKFIFLLLLCPLFTMAQSIIFQGELLSGNHGTDVWEYIDPNNGNVYAIIGGNGMSIVDVTDPTNPTQVAHVTSVPGFDVKVWENYVYCVNGGSGVGSIVDISDPTNPVVAGTFPSSHNLFIDDNGIMYGSFPSLRIFDLNPDPLNPTLLTVIGTEGHDATVRGNLLIDCHGYSGTNLYDVSDPSAPVLLSSITDPTITYHHQGEVSSDGNYLYINDELANNPTPDISVWDISDIANPVRVSDFADQATTHNMYVIGDYAYVSYYTAGFRVFDISDPSQLVLVDEYDTNPASGEGFSGAFGIYPSPVTGNIYINDSDGVFVFKFDALFSIDDEVNLNFTMSPNPADNQTILSLENDTVQSVQVHTILGTNLFEENLQDGITNYTLDLSTFSTGVYFVTVNNSQTRKLIVR